MFPETWLIDIEVLRLVWWGLTGILFMGYAVMAGFDVGVASLLPFLGKSEMDKRVMLNTVGPVWEGNQVWLILGAGTIFAAWPTVYAVAFSLFYIPLFIALIGLILRPVGFTYRSKMTHQLGKVVMDRVIVIGGVLPSLMFGLVLGNIVQGVGFSFDQWMRIKLDDSFIAMFNPFAILSSLLTLGMFMMHGSVFLAGKSEGMLSHRARHLASRLVPSVILLFTLAGFWVAINTGYRIEQGLAPDNLSNPLSKVVSKATGAWLDNFRDHPLFLLAPGLVYVASIVLWVALSWRRFPLAFVMSSFMVAGIVMTCGLTMYPFLLPSSSVPSMGLTIFDSSSSQLTLQIMLLAALVLMPLVVLYTGFIYNVVKGRVSEQDIAAHSQEYY